MDRIDTALLLVRLFFGVSLFWHGVNKVRSGLPGTASWFASIGMKWPVFQAHIAAATEIVAGVSLAAGFLTPLASAAVLATMIVAIVTVHWKVGFFIFLPGGGWEYCASIGVVAAAMSYAGPGRWSVDEALGIAWNTTSGIAGIVLGVGAALAHLGVSWRRPGAPL